MGPHSGGEDPKAKRIPLWAYACSFLWLLTVFGFPALHCVLLHQNYGQLLWRRTVAGVTTPPPWRGWCAFAASLAAVFLIAGAFGVKTGFCSWPPRRAGLSWRHVTFRLAQTYVTPGLFEELLFRVIPLPARHEVPAVSMAWRAATLLVCVCTFAGPFHVDYLHHRGPPTFSRTGASWSSRSSWASRARWCTWRAGRGFSRRPCTRCRCGRGCAS